MELIKLFSLLAVMMVMLVGLKKPLWLGTAVAIIFAIIIYAIAPDKAAQLAIESLTERSTIEILAVLYLVNFLQVMMQKKGALIKAERSMMRFFNNRRSIIMFAPIFLGLLPAPNSIVLSAPIIESTAEDYLTKGEKTFLTGYFRHVPESSLPFYPALLLALNVTGLSAGLFLLGVIPLAIASVVFCYYTTGLRNVPKETGLPPSDNRKQDFIDMLMSLWPIIVLIIAVLFGGFNTALATLAACVVLYIVYRFPISELWSILKESFLPKLIVSMALIMVLRGVVASTGIIDALPAMFETLPVPLYLMYAIITFIGGMTGLGNAVVAMMFPIAFATVPNAGIPLLILLMSYSHSAAQISPTHICLEVAVKAFDSDYRTLIGKTIPVTIFYCVISVLYYLLLVNIF